MQAGLQERYQDKWQHLSPEIGKDQLLWLMIELGEVADIIKKEGSRKIMEDNATREHFIEEMADVMMHYNDVLLCYGILTDEFSKIYQEKHQCLQIPLRKAEEPKKQPSLTRRAGCFFNEYLFVLI